MHVFGVDGKLEPPIGYFLLYFLERGDDLFPFRKADDTLFGQHGGPGEVVEWIFRFLMNAVSYCNKSRLLQYLCIFFRFCLLTAERKHPKK